MDDAERFGLLYALDRAMRGARRCKDRLITAADTAPGILGRVIDQRGAFTNDLDYWAVEAIRVENTATTVATRMSSGDLATAVAKFQEATEGLRDLRNFVSHRDDSRRLIPHLTYFGTSAVELLSHGQVRYLADPEGQHQVVLYDLYRSARRVLDPTDDRATPDAPEGWLPAD